MEQYLIDTNVISDYFSASLPASGLQFMDAVIDVLPNLSDISQIELLCWKTDAAKEQQVKDFIADSTIFDITPDVIAHCVSIRRNKKVKTPVSRGFRVIIDFHILSQSFYNHNKI